jgi:5S rRNA maturation endonuclease (ribonuclease M5)
MVGIIHEGKTDREFFTTLLETFNLPNTQNDIKYYNFEGIDNIFKISHSYYDEIEKDNILSSILIVIDADKKHDELKQKLKNLFKEEN